MRVEPSSIVVCTGALMLLPATVAACSLCIDSMVYSTTPWLPVAFLVLLAWWVLSLVISRNTLAGGPMAFSLQSLAIIFGTSIFVLVFAGTGIFMVVACTYIAVHLAQEIVGPRISMIAMRRILAIGTLVALTAVAAIGVWHRSQLSLFQVYERYVWSGTRVSDSMSTTLAEDSDFDVELLRPLLESTEWHRADMAFFVLEKRRDPKDLVRFADVIKLRLPETVPLAAQPWKSEEFYLRWLEQLDLQHIRTRADLDEWLIQMAPQAKDASDREPWSEP